MKKHESPGTSAVCPDCGGYEMSVVCQLYECYFDREKATALPSGFRVSCQRCGAIFSVNKNGTYRHHEQALPWTPKPRLMNELLPEKPLAGPPTGPLGPPPRAPNAANDSLPFRTPSAR